MTSPEIDLNTADVPLDLNQVFGRTAPVHIEIGSGKGRFLLATAAKHPELDFVGVERAAKYHKIVCDKVARRGITNVRLLQTTAEDLLFRLLEPETVHAVYVLFPDPWPKKRHHKRRFVNRETVDAMAKALIDGGMLRIKSDHQDYAQVISEILPQVTSLTPLDASTAFDGLPRTGFECKYLEEGRKIHAFACRKGK